MMDILRQQHDAAVKVIDCLLRQARRHTPGEDDYAIVLQLAKLAALLRLHFALEDRTVFAPLLDSPDAEVARLAARQFAEFGGLTEQVELFAIRWSSRGAINAQLDRFRAELTELSARLRQRIAQEESCLYALAEGMEPLRAAA